MKRGVALLLLLAVTTALYCYLRLQQPRSEPTPPPTSYPQASSTSDARKVSRTNLEPGAPLASLVAPPPSAPVALLPASNSLVPATATVPPMPPELESVPPATVLENMRRSIRQYGTMFGGNPVGTNPEITKALQGDNPKQINFLKADGNRVNGNGELVDPWGTPYFFHQLSGTEMEIRSAGPDKRMWTADDLVVR